MLLTDNPDVIKVFTKSTNLLSLESIKGCLLGTAKTILLKCTKLFNEDFPNIQSIKQPFYVDRYRLIALFIYKITCFN